MTAGLILNTTPGVSIARGGHTYVPGVKFSTGGVFVHRLNHSTKKVDQVRYLTGVYPADDHMANATMRFLPDGRLTVFYTGHEQDGVLRFRVSEDSSPLRFGPEVTALTLTETTYTRSFQFGDKIWGMTRESRGAGSGGWDITEADISDLTTWMRRKRIWHAGLGQLSNMQAYIYGGAVDPENANAPLLRGVPLPTGNPEGKMGFVRWDLSTGDVSYSGGTAGNIEDGTNDTPLVTYGQMQAIIVAPANRALNAGSMVNNGTRFLSPEFDEPGGTNRIFRLGRYQGGDMTLAANWQVQQATEFDGYITAVLDQRDPTGNSLYAQRLNGATYDIERWASADDGDTWEFVETYDSHAVQARNLIQPVDASAALPLIWSRGEYTEFNDQNLDMRWALTQ